MVKIQIKRAKIRINLTPPSQLNKQKRFISCINGKGNLIFNIPHLLQWLSLRSSNHLPQSTLERPQSQFVLNLPWHSVA